MQDLRAAAQWPLDSGVLPRLYLSLLHCLLREQVHMIMHRPALAGIWLTFTSQRSCKLLHA